MPNKSLHQTKPLVTHLACASCVPTSFAGEANVRQIFRGRRIVANNLHTGSSRLLKNEFRRPEKAQFLARGRTTNHVSEPEVKWHRRYSVDYQVLRGLKNVFQQPARPEPCVFGYLECASDSR